MKSKHQTDIGRLLYQWMERKIDLDNAFDKLKEAVGETVESPLFNAAYVLFDAYTDATAKLVNDNGQWLTWFMYDNDAGANEMEASPGKRYPMREIKTLEDLEKLIAQHNACASVKSPQR
jgi:hypothetical protein